MSTEENRSPAPTFQVSLTVSARERSINSYSEHIAQFADGTGQETRS